MDKAQRKFWDKNGYILLENVLTEDECIFIRGIVTQLANWERKKMTPIVTTTILYTQADMFLS